MDQIYLALVLLIALFALLGSGLWVAMSLLERNEAVGAVAIALAKLERGES